MEGVVFKKSVFDQGYVLRTPLMFCYTERGGPSGCFVDRFSSTEREELGLF